MKKLLYYEGFRECVLGKRINQEMKVYEIQHAI